jgi:hypothetical protein
MKFLNNLERKFGRFAIHDLMRYIITLNVLGVFLGVLDPTNNFGIYTQYLSLDIGKVMQGQIWRLFTFILKPGLSRADIINPINIFFFAVTLYLYFMIGNSLENAWGAFRFNLYYLSGILLNIVAAVLVYAAFGASYDFGLTYVNESMFLAFAALFPNMELLLFFVLPVKVKWFGILYGVMIVWEIFTNFVAGNYIAALAIIIAFANFLIFFLSSRNYRKISPKEYQRKAKFKRNIQNSSSITRHKCAVCGRTEKDDENLEFRFCSKCEGNYEYCSDHLFSHEHVHKR